MATFALSVAGQFVGGMLGGPIGATVGRALGALAGSAVDAAIFGGGETRARPASDIRLSGSSEGGGVPRIYGWTRLAGNIIWAGELEEIRSEGRGGKGFGGGGEQGEDAIVASFAVAFCEGEVHRLGRIWADGQALDAEGVTLRFYPGSETQAPDSLIEAMQGAGRAPAYRGVCYIVFERLALARFGNRIPSISVELCRVAGDLEPAVRAITVIPGATEFGYDPAPRLRLVGPGASRPENAHLSAAASDWSLSIDELTALCPGLEHVALVVAWFGSDLRCADCAIGPRVEAGARAVEGPDWSVAGLTRGEVPVVSSHGGGPAYGGTPSDAAVRAAIADLKARGLKVTLYPFILMDIPHGNGLEDPYGGDGGQAGYPWRGRITCDPAPGREGSPEGTGAVEAQVSAFLTKGYRDLHLHYAGLAAAAGGVDAILIGSEMVGMTRLRGAEGYPFVAGLVALAGEVRALVGPATKITYAADWSEYSGHQTGDGGKVFHLDPLWASDDIDAVGIDNYMPLSDWREGTGHADAGVADTPHDLDYLMGNIAGGEGFDWHYAGSGDRVSGVRTPISDGAHGEPFVWRYKDLLGWWSSYHHDRPGGVRAEEPTGWAPGSKPIWFTELGCGAVDKGANQPNVFGDPKSAEGGLPYFSSGAADGLMQRQFLRAHLRHWADPENNPPGMVDVDRIYLWTWDARPFPAFPALDDVWADGGNHAAGHWLTGRLGGGSSAEMARAIAEDFGVELGRAAAEGPLVSGYALDMPMTAREALEGLAEIAGLRIAARAEGVVLLGRGRETGTIAEAGLVEGEGFLLSRKRAGAGEAIGRMVLGFADRERDYLAGTATALIGDGAGLEARAMGVSLDLAGARLAAETMLSARGREREEFAFSLPLSRAEIEIGDVVRLEGRAEGLVEIVEIREGRERRVKARGLPAPVRALTTARRGGGLSTPPVRRGLPVVHVAHLPPLPEAPGRSRLAIGAHAEPWPGPVTLSAEGADLAVLRGRAMLGETISGLAPGPVAVWDRAGRLEVRFYAGHVTGLGEAGALAGSRRVAVETDAGDWEVIGFAEAELTAPDCYRLSGLLRGLEGTDPAMGPIGAGQRVMLLDGRETAADLPGDWLGVEIAARIYGGPGDLVGREMEIGIGAGPVLALPPAHPAARRTGEDGDVALSWVRRSRADGGGWGLGEVPLEHAPERYLVAIRDGETVVRSFTTEGPSALYGAAEQLADFGGPAAGFSFSVRQVSPIHGPGHAAWGEFHG